jgi:hypothetical protein
MRQADLLQLVPKSGCAIELTVALLENLPLKDDAVVKYLEYGGCDMCGCDNTKVNCAVVCSF